MKRDIRWRRWSETGAIILIGDGVLTLIRPVRRSLLWWMPWPGVRQLMEWCARHPNASRAIGLAQIVFALWWDASQYDD